MLDQNDIEMIAQLLDARAIKTEKLLLDEIERTRNGLEKKIETVQRNLEEINQYYRITKLENDNTTLLLKMIDELSKRVAELEKRTA